MPGHAGRVGGNLPKRACGHDLPAANARPRAEIDDVIGCAHRVFVVLDHDDRVALVAEAAQGAKQAAVVAGVQTDRRLVKDIKHAHQAAADLPCQADALHFAAGKRGGGAVEREIIEPHILEELQAAADLLQRLGGDCLAGGVQFQFGEKLLGFSHRQRRPRAACAPACPET